MNGNPTSARFDNKYLFRLPAEAYIGDPGVIGKTYVNPEGVAVILTTKMIKDEYSRVRDVVQKRIKAAKAGGYNEALQNLVLPEIRDLRSLAQGDESAFQQLLVQNLHIAAEWRADPKGTKTGWFAAKADVNEVQQILRDMVEEYSRQGVEMDELTEGDFFDLVISQYGRKHLPSDAIQQAYDVLTRNAIPLRAVRNHIAEFVENRFEAERKWQEMKHDKDFTGDPVETLEEWLRVGEQYNDQKAEEELARHAEHR